MEAHKGRSQKAVWGNDVSLPSQQSTSARSKVKIKQDEDDSASDEEDSASDKDEKEDSDDEEG